MRREGISLRCYIRKGGGVGWIGKEERKDDSTSKGNK